MYFLDVKVRNDQKEATGYAKDAIKQPPEDGILRACPAMSAQGRIAMASNDAKLNNPNIFYWISQRSDKKYRDDQMGKRQPVG